MHSKEGIYFQGMSLLQGPELLELKSHALELLIILLENTSVLCSDLVQCVSEEIPIFIIWETMQDLWRSSVCDMSFVQTGTPFTKFHCYTFHTRTKSRRPIKRNKMLRRECFTHFMY